MNRLRKQTASSFFSGSLPAELSEAFSATAVEDAPRKSPPYALFTPLHFQPNYEYPLVIWLHGPNDNEQQLRRVMPHISLRNYLAIAPRGTQTDETLESAYDWCQSDEAFALAEDRVFECLDLAKRRFAVHAGRVFLAGYLSGGTMAFRIGLENPRHFAGVLSVGGPFPNVGRPLSSVVQARNLPLFIAQGRDAESYPVERACEELRLFHAAGLSVTLRQYPGGDELHSLVLRDMDAWIMDQINGVPSQIDEAPTCPTFGLN